MGNLKLAFRMLAKSPYVTTIAILSLGLGIGANAAMYSVFDEMLRRPLPVAHPERLVNFVAPGPRQGSNSCNMAGGCDEVFSYRMFRDLEQATSTPFSGVAAHLPIFPNISYHNQTQSARGSLVSGSYFGLLGVNPAAGRLISQADDQTVGANYVAVLSYDYWTTKLGGSNSVLGESMIIDGQPFTIIGVTQQGFTGTVLGVEPQVYVPLSMRGVTSPGFTGFDNRRWYWAYLFARLKPGVTMAQASAAINGVYHGIINDVEVPLQKGLSDATMAKFKAKQLVLNDGSRGQSAMRQGAAPPLAVMLGVTAIVLLIACVNIANLLLARGAGRASEVAVRISLGATRWRIVSQLLTESVLLAAVGGVLSLFVAYWTLAMLKAMLPFTTVPFHVALHPSVLVYTLLISVGTGILFGLFPALQTTSPDLVTGLRSAAGKHSGARSASRFRTILATSQIALAMALLSSAGLFIKSLYNVSRVDLGLNVDNVITFSISPVLNGYDSTRSRAFYAQAEDALAALPGVTGVSDATIGVLAGNNSDNNVSVEGFTKGPDTDADASYNQVGAGYFHILGIPVLQGREFTTSDVAGSPKVVIVNEAFAKKFGLGRDAVGKHMTNGNGPLDLEIIGLVKDAKYSDVKNPVPPLFFLPYRQVRAGFMNFYVRTAATQTPQVVRAITPTMAKLDPNLPVDDIKTMPQQVRENTFIDRFDSQLSAGFALLATLLAAIGLYGVLAYSIAQRTREIGVRQALGASAGNIRSMVLRQVGWMTAIGGVIGIAGAIGLGRAARAIMYGLETVEPWVLIVATLLLGLVALGAGYVPARRASRVAPMEALRDE